MIGRGLTHKCTPTNTARSIIDILNTDTDEMKHVREQVVSAGLKSIAAEKDIKVGERVPLATFGNTAAAVIPTKPSDSGDTKVLLPDGVAELQKKLELSTRKTNKMMMLLRKHGMKIESYARESVQEASKRLDVF